VREQGARGVRSRVLVANARRIRLIYANKRKTYEMDAENLARLARLDPKLLYPLKHRNNESQAHMALIRSREALVSSRTQLVNPGYAERSSPSGPACPIARQEASTRRERPSTSPRPSGRHLGPSWCRLARLQSASGTTSASWRRSPRRPTHKKPSSCGRSQGSERLQR
jgi:hypothetical protein